MIQVQIASSLDSHGVGGARWVLVDPAESGAEPARPARVAPAAPAAPLPATAVRGTPMTLRAITAAVLLAALAGAWWLSDSLLAPGAAAPSVAGTTR